MKCKLNIKILIKSTKTYNLALNLNPKNSLFQFPYPELEILRS